MLILINLKYLDKSILFCTFVVEKVKKTTKPQDPEGHPRK